MDRKEIKENIENIRWKLDTIMDELRDIEDDEEEFGIEKKIKEIFSDYNNIWAEDTKEQKLVEAIKNLKQELKY